MDRIRELIALLVIGGVVGVALLSRPAPANNNAIAYTFPAVTLALPLTPTSPTVYPTPTIQPTSTPPPQQDLQQGPQTPTPEAFYAQDIAGTATAMPGAPHSGSSPPTWNPPAIEVPIARHPYDHYWLIRPVASTHTNYAAESYLYGSNGLSDNLRVHHGIDIINPVGVEVLAAGSGTVIWTGRGHTNEYESISSYGNTVVITHDFSHHGKPVYTLYAHLSAALVQPGQRVEAGDRIGLIGSTGASTGSHLHFEVRVGRNSYFSVRNPMLWIAPYTGTGVIAGRITSQGDQVIYDLSVAIIDMETGRVARRASTYANYSVSPDDNWNETFIFPDVPTGHYLVTATSEGVTWSAEVQVVSGATNWAEMIRHDPVAGATQEPEED